MYKGILIFIALASSICAAPALTYSTLFPGTENPISEGANWTNGAAEGIDWKNCQTTPGRAFGTQVSGDTGFDDSTAILKGAWNPNQKATGTVFIDPNSDTGNQEVEFRFRTKISAHLITGYEVTFSCRPPPNAYVQIVRWNGALSDFTYVNNSDTVHFVQNGDVITAAMIGNVISVYINGSLIITGTDSTYTSGSIGMGFYLDHVVNPAHYGLTSFSATDVLNTFTPAPFGK